MIEDIKAHDQGRSDQTDSTSNTLITDFTRMFSCTVGSDRAERRREKIREELVREHLAHEQIERR